MNKNIIIIVAVFVIALGLVLVKSVSININTKGTSAAQPLATNQGSKSGIETKENGEGSLSVAVTPDSLESREAVWNFQIALNTHSGSIDTDLVSATYLIDDKGNVYKPISWDGAAPGGHHRSGVLKFNPISPRPKSIELKIKDVGGISERSFKWDL